MNVAIVAGRRAYTASKLCDVLFTYQLVPNVSSAARSGWLLADMISEPTFERISGRYCVGARDVPSSKDSYDPGMAMDLREASAAMVKLTPDETILRSGSTPSAA